MSQHLIDRVPGRPSEKDGGGALTRPDGVDFRSVLGALTPGERLITGGSLLLLVALFLDWISVSCTGPLCGLGSTGGGGGLHGWGWLTFLALLAAAGLLVSRRVLADRITVPGLPASDAVLYMAIGGVELAGCLLFWLQYHDAFISAGPISVGLGLGWPLAILAGAVTVAGGYLMHTREVS